MWFFCFVFKTLSRYPKWHSSFVNVFISWLSIAIYLAGKCLLFRWHQCLTGVVPTFPGMSDMFSKPPKFWSIVHSTNSCQLSPAWLSTQKIFVFFNYSLSFQIDMNHQCLLVKSMLLPPPKINFCCALFSCKIVFKSFTEWTATNCFALASMPKVLYFESRYYFHKRLLNCSVLRQK
jgi:hypothetical protein